MENLLRTSHLLPAGRGERMQEVIERHHIRAKQLHQSPVCNWNVSVQPGRTMAGADECGPSGSGGKVSGIEDGL